MHYSHFTGEETKDESFEQHTTSCEQEIELGLLDENKNF